MGDRLERAGFLLGYHSEYLRSRNWIQVCLMGELSSTDVETLLAAIASFNLSPSAVAGEQGDWPDSECRDGTRQLTVGDLDIVVS